MQFISTEDMKKFEELGYTFSSKYTPCNVGSTYHVIVTDKDGNEVIHTQCSYGNGSGHGYAMNGAQLDAVGQLKAIINGEVEEEEEYDLDFLNTLANWDYITDYGYTKRGELLIMFGGWSQVEGSKTFNKETNEWEITSKSVYAKLCELADKNLLKPSINKTIKEVEYVFDDEYMKCDECGCICNITWDGIRYVDETGKIICDDCLNKDEESIEALIGEAKENFSKALPVMISEEKLEEMGYEKLDPETDFSTRAEQYGESSWGSHNVHHEVIEKLCKKYNGFPKLTWVGQFDCEYNAFFPKETIDEARIEAHIYPDSEEYHNTPVEV